MARDDAASEEVPAGVSDQLPAKRARRLTPSIITIDSDTPERETRRNGNRHASPPVDLNAEARFQATLRAFLETSAAYAQAGEIPTGLPDPTASFDILSQRVSLAVPVFCREPLLLSSLFEEVRRRGGYHAVTAQKQWRSVCVALGFDLEGQTSASFAMRRNYEKTGLYLFEVTGGDAKVDRAAAAAPAAAAAAAAGQSRV